MLPFTFVAVGRRDGRAIGALVGLRVGRALATYCVGLRDMLGLAVGKLVGIAVGAKVGALVGR